MDNSEKELIKFVHPPFYQIIIGIMTLIVFAGIGVVSVDMFRLIVWSLGGIACFIYFTVFEYVLPYVRMMNAIKGAKQRGDHQVLINDFKNAGRAFKDSLILGDGFMIAKGSGSIYRYSDLTRLFHVVETSGGIVIRHKLYIYDLSDKKRRLCYIDRSAYDRDEMQSVYAYIISKNPIIKLGEK